MHRIFTGLCVAAALGFGVSLGAQSQPTRSARPVTMQHETTPVTLEGCVQKNKSGGYFLTRATLATPRQSPAPAGTTGTTSSGKPDVAHAPINQVKTWNLEHGKHMDRYVGKRVRVRGDAEAEQSGDQLKGTSGVKGRTGRHEIQARDIDVTSIRTLAGSCSR